MKYTLSKNNHNIALACTGHSFGGSNPWVKVEKSGKMRTTLRECKRETWDIWKAMRDAEWKRWGRKRERWHKQRTEKEEWLKVNCSTGLARCLASVLESLSHPQWHVVSRPLPHYIIVLCAIMWAVHMYSPLCWLHKTHGPNCFCSCQCVPLNLI